MRKTLKIPSANFRFALFVAFLIVLSDVSFAGKLFEIEANSNCNSVCAKIQEIYAKASFSVLIRTDGESSELGSGVLIKDLEVFYILTNNHVVEKSPERLWLSFRGVSGFYETKTIGRSPAADLALLEAPILPRGVRPTELEDELKFGQQIYAVGYPFGIFDVSFGYVNANETFSWLYAWTQAPVNPGNSGGPVLNEELKVMGINTAVGGVTPKSFVLPVEYVRRLLPRLKTETLIRHGKLGFGFADPARLLPSFFRSLGMTYNPLEQRLVIISVPPNSPAERAGLRRGDFLRKFNGTEFRNFQELDMTIFFDYRPGNTVTLLIERGGQAFERQIVLQEYENPIAAMIRKGKNNNENR